MDKKMSVKLLFYSISLMVIIPIIINILMYIHILPVAGDEGDWIGTLGSIWGSIIGGVIAGVITLIGVNRTIESSFEAVDRSYKHQKEIQDADEKERHEYTVNLIEKFIFQEMRDNLKRIPKNCLDALRKRGENQLVSYSINANFSYKTYEDLKYELVKNLRIKKSDSEDYDFIDGLIDFYGFLMILENRGDIDSLNPIQASLMYECFIVWNDTLDLI